MDFINSSFENGAESNDFTVVNCAGASGHLLSGGTDNSENFVIDIVKMTSRDGFSGQKETPVER